MDSTIGRIVDYAGTLHYGRLPAAVVHECKRRVIDTLGCALGAYHAEPSRIARGIALRAGTTAGARVLGTAHRALPELAVTPNIALEATRRGKLSMWKGCAAGNAARNGVFAALIAAAGMTGPEKPVEDIETVTVYTDRFTWYEIGSEPEKWHPTTRETADHSLPFIVAAVLIDGRFSDDIFSDERLRDQRIHRLADRISVKEEAEFSRRFPRAIPCRIEIATKSGEHKIAAVEYPRGHINNPMTDDEVNTKFRRLAERVLPKAQTEHALELLWKLDEAADLGSIFEALQVTNVS